MKRLASPESPHGLEKPLQLFTQELSWAEFDSKETVESGARIADDPIQPTLSERVNLTDITERTVPRFGSVRKSRGEWSVDDAANYDSSGTIPEPARHKERIE
jgi:hypothetical protein